MISPHQKIEQKCSTKFCKATVEVFARMVDNESYVKLFGRCRKCIWQSRLRPEQKDSYKKKLFARPLFGTEE